ncbi:ribosomal protein L13e [Candidatus Bathyarchaeota archaeon]|jgi:ribosomal protein L13E|nr:ribosomal protein L13e [Candidatus Bathyarchaeota archaeon]
MTTVEPKVYKRDGNKRRGKGFSLGELEKAGSNQKEALKSGLHTDSKRRTVHEENVETLTNFFKNRKATPKPKRKSKS